MCKGSLAACKSLCLPLNAKAHAGRVSSIVKLKGGCLVLGKVMFTSARMISLNMWSIQISTEYVNVFFGFEYSF